VGLQRGPISLVSTTEELLGRKSSCSGLEIREYGRRGSVTLTTWHPRFAKVGTSFVDKRRPLGRHGTWVPQKVGTSLSESLSASEEGHWSKGLLGYSFEMTRCRSKCHAARSKKAEGLTVSRMFWPICSAPDCPIRSAGLLPATPCLGPTWRRAQAVTFTLNKLRMPVSMSTPPPSSKYLQNNFAEFNDQPVDLNRLICSSVYWSFVVYLRPTMCMQGHNMNWGTD
jgi:hypothetical protein